MFNMYSFFKNISLSMLISFMLIKKSLVSFGMR